MMSGRQVLARVHAFKPTAMPRATTDECAVLGGSDFQMYRRGDAEIGAAARDGEGKMYPAWVLRNLMLSKWAREEDFRVRAYSYVLLDDMMDFRIYIDAEGAKYAMTVGLDLGHRLLRRHALSMIWLSSRGL